jgi:hypothetical protein
MRFAFDDFWERSGLGSAQDRRANPASRGALSAFKQAIPCFTAESFIATDTGQARLPIFARVKR